MTVMGIKKGRDDLAENLGELLLVMELADFTDNRPEWWTETAKALQFQPLRFIQEVEPTMGTGMDPITKGQTEEMIDPNELAVTPSDLDVPLNVATVSAWDMGGLETTGEDPETDGTWLFERFGSVPPEILVKHNPSPTPIMVEHVMVKATVGADIKYESLRNFFIYEEGGVWRPVQWTDEMTGEMLSDKTDPPGMAHADTLLPDPDHEESVAWFDMIDYTVKSAMARQFARRYQWRVLFRDHPRGTASLSMLTDPKGALAAFKLRDKPRGAKRRPALKHWVRKHWRQTRGGTSEALVKAHLRGETRFIFEGMECLILPSPFDVERVKRGKA